MRGLLIAAAMLVATPALAQPAAPEPFVRSLYAPYFDPKAKLDEAAVYEPGLLALMQKAQAGGALPADPICACQDYDFKAVSLATRSADAKAATVTASFVNFGKPRAVTFTLVMTPKGWRVTDIASADTPSLRAALH